MSNEKAVPEIDVERIRDFFSIEGELALANKYGLLAERELLKPMMIVFLESYAALQAEVDALKWQPITPENMPKVGDEVGMFPFDPSNYGYMVGYAMAAWMHADWKDAGWTHFRPINPPTVARATPPQDVENGGKQ